MSKNPTEPVDEPEYNEEEGEESDDYEDIEVRHPPSSPPPSPSYKKLQANRI